MVMKKKSTKIKTRAHSWCLDVFFQFSRYFTSMSSNTFPPPSTTSNNRLLLFHGGQKALQSTWADVYGDRNIFRTYNVDATVRGRYTADKVEVSTPNIPDSRDCLSVDHPQARPIRS